MEDSKIIVSIKLDEEGTENNISIERTCDGCYATSSEVMTAVLDAMKGLGYHLKYEDDIRDMIEESRPSI